MKLPILLVTGFLGSGKTTFLRRLASQHPERRLLFLVNEFSETGVDADTLKITGRPTQSVVGGSLFCECKASEFVRVMRERVLSEHEALALDAVVIETSGIADPEAIGVLMHEHGLSEHFEVQQIIAIASPKRLPKLYVHLPSIRAQIDSSQTIILNKIDLATDVETAEAEALIRKSNPTAKILHASHCEVAFSFEQLCPKLPNAPLSDCDANPFSTETVFLDRSISNAALGDWLQALPASILRVKGSAQTDQGWRELQKTVDSQSLVECPAQAHSQLILIAHDDDAAALQTATEQLQALATGSVI